MNWIKNQLTNVALYIVVISMLFLSFFIPEDWTDRMVESRLGRWVERCIR